MFGKESVIKVKGDGGVIKHGDTLIDCRADGSVWINGQQVFDPKTKNVAALAAQQPQTQKAQQQAPAQNQQAQPAAAQEEQQPAAPAEPTAEEKAAAAAAEAEAEAARAAEEVAQALKTARKEYFTRMEKEKAEARDAATKESLRTVGDITQATKAGEDAATLAEQKFRALNPEPTAAAPVQQQAAAPQQTPGTTEQPATPPAPVAAGYQVGQTIEDKGVFVGTWKPKGLSKVFNVFAAPEDLTDEKDNKAVLTFNETVARIDALEDWNGHDGSKIASEPDLIKALRKDDYDGGWVVPPLPLMIDDKKPGPLLVAQDIGDLEDTFEAVAGQPTSQWYWSCTTQAKDTESVHYVKFNAEPGEEMLDYTGKNLVKLATRPVRFEAV